MNWTRLFFAVVVFCTLTLVRCELPTISFGQTLDFSNQRSTEYRKGLLAAFNDTNFNLVVGGSTNVLKFSLQALDDNGNAALAVSNIQSLLASNATYIIGQAGTESAVEAGANAANASSTPYLAPASGNPALFSQYRQSIVNIRVSYQDEIVGLIDYLTYDLVIARISILHDNTELSTNLASYAQSTLEYVGLRVESNASYDVNWNGDDNVLASALTNLQQSSPEAIIMIGDYRPLARFTVLAKAVWPQIVCSTISKVNTDAFISTISDAGGSISNIVFSQVVPPATSASPLVSSYKAAMKKSGYMSTRDYSFASLEGYLAGKAIYATFWNAYVFSGLYSVDAFYTALQSPTGILVPVSGFHYSLGPFTDSCKQGSHNVYINSPSGASLYTLLKTFSYTTCSADLTYLMRPIVFGQSAGLSGADATAVSSFRAGVKVAFAEYNAETGVQYFNPSNPRNYRQKLVHSFLDDAGTENKTAVNIGKFISKHKVFGLIGPSGTASAHAASTIAAATLTPLIGPFSGSIGLRAPYNRYVVNIRASELAEAAAIADYLVKLNVEKVGLYFNRAMFDATSGYPSLLAALKSKNIIITFTNTTLEKLSSAIATLEDNTPDAVILYGAPQELNTFAQSALSSDKLKDIIFVTYSILGTPQPPLSSFAKLYQSTVVPPLDYPIPATTSFLKAVSGTSVVPDLVAFEGYITGRAIGSILKMYPDGVLNQEKFLDVVYPAVINVDGLGYGAFSSSCNQGARQVWVGRVVPGKNISYVHVLPFSNCEVAIAYNQSSAAYLRNDSGSKSTSASIGVGVGIAVPVVIAAVIIGFFFTRNFMNKSKKEKLDEEVQFMLPDKITSVFADPKIPGQFPYQVSPLQLQFGGGEQPDVDKMVSDFVTLNNPVGNKPYRFSFLTPPKSDKYQLTVYPRRGKLRPGTSMDIRIDLIFFCTTRLSCKIMLETEAIGADTPPVHCMLSIDKGSALSTKLDFDEIKMIGAPIGDGSFGTVYRGTWRGQDVAIKMLKAQMDLSEMQLADLLREVNIMNKLRNPNIVSFAGAVTTPGKMCLVTEFVPLGNLTRYLGKNMLSYAQKVKIALDTANGMNFLHSGGILHRDLKPDNLLVSSLNVNAPAMIKLSDFGSSRSINEELARNYTSGIGTPIYMAPEILTKEAYSVKADVYSFSILLYELFDEKEPYQDFKHSWDVARYVTEGKRPPKLEKCPDDYWSIIEKCWDHDPQKRPNFEEILADLQKIFHELPEESILAAIANTFGSVRGNAELSADPRYGKLRSMSKSEGYRLVVEKINEEKPDKTKSLGRDEEEKRRRRRHRRRSKAGSKAKSAPLMDAPRERKAIQANEITIDMDDRKVNNSKSTTVSFDTHTKV